jgi:hypothetical protein
MKSQTWEVEIDEHNFLVTGTYNPGEPRVTSGPSDRWYPGSPECVEIDKVELMLGKRKRELSAPDILPQWQVDFPLSVSKHDFLEVRHRVCRACFGVIEGRGHRCPRLSWARNEHPYWRSRTGYICDKCFSLPAKIVAWDYLLEYLEGKILESINEGDCGTDYDPQDAAERRAEIMED